jgi:hypothetical protein
MGRKVRALTAWLRYSSGSVKLLAIKRLMLKSIGNINRLALSRRRLEEPGTGANFTQVSHMCPSIHCGHYFIAVD